MVQRSDLISTLRHSATDDKEKSPPEAIDGTMELRMIQLTARELGVFRAVSRELLEDAIPLDESVERLFSWADDKASRVEIQ